MVQMLSLVVSAALLPVGQAQPKAVRQAQQPAWGIVSRSLAVLKDANGAGIGFAVLVGKDGMFLASRTSVRSPVVEATISGPKNITFDLVGDDKTTQLVALQARDWDGKGRSPVAIVDHEVRSDEVLLAASASGPVAGQLTNQRRPGILDKTQFVPFYEIRLESTTDLLGGAVVFTQTGDLVGILSATQGAELKMPGNGLQPTITAGGTAPAAYQKSLNNYGPQGLTVGYVLGPRVLRRVIDGFASPSHQVKHPYIGVEFRELVKGRVTLTTVTADAPAFRAGLRAGDAIIKIGDVAVQSSVHLASMLFEAKPGETLSVTIERNGDRSVIAVPVGVHPQSL